MNEQPKPPKPIACNVIADVLMQIIPGLTRRAAALHYADRVIDALDEAGLCELTVDREWVARNRPLALHTWDWREHPEEYEGECYCLECRMSS